ncbi:MAG: hypothetical protein IT480_04625 [Gammaproteobacteria bacterium]|nr:hypothetical protein [Gammaproteobacteria bacterium]
MNDDAISRRQLLATGMQVTAALAIAGTLAPGPATAGAADGATAGVEAYSPTPTFYDPRFPVSRLRARALPGRPQLRPIRGDPTAALALVSEARAGGVRRLQGVTTESIPFCLHEFAGRGPGVQLDCQRVDRDLFVWTLTLGDAPAGAVAAATAEAAT